METLFIGCCDVFEQAHVRPKEGRTLIVGSRVYREKPDRRRRYPDAIGVDMQEGEGVDLVLDLEEKLPADIGTFAHVECQSVLEHSRRPWLMAANIERLLKPGGTLYVTVPFVWRVHAYPDDYWRMTPAGLQSLFPLVDWETMAFGYGDQVGSVEKKLPTIKRMGIPYFGRTETLGFGIRR